MCKLGTGWPFQNQLCCITNVRAIQNSKCGYPKGARFRTKIKNIENLDVFFAILAKIRCKGGFNVQIMYRLAIPLPIVMHHQCQGYSKQ